MQQFRRLFAAVLAILGLAAGATVASADRGHDHNGRGHDHRGRGGAERLFTLPPDPAGNPEGVAFDRRSGRSTSASQPAAPSTAARSAARRCRRTSTAATGKSAVGLKVRRGKLYVAGGATGSITVYDLATKRWSRLPDRQGRVPRRPRRDPPRRRLRHRLVPADPVACDRRAGAPPAGHAAGAGRARRFPTSPRARSTSTGSSRWALASSSSSTPTAASCSGSSSSGDRGLDS